MIDPIRKSIHEILSDNILFKVPEYQRNFEWGTSELEELMEDLSVISEDSDNDKLFLGTFIFDVSNEKVQKIVDGQQRLTTISMILIAIREHAKRINEEKIASEIQRYISSDSSWSKNQGNKLTVSENIRNVFDYISEYKWDGLFPERINGKGCKKESKKLKPIFDSIYGHFKTYNKDKLTNFISSLLDNSYVILVKVNNQNDVYAIFERTNARGLDLNIGDLLKNYIFSKGLEKYEDIWSEIISNAEGSFQRLLKYFWVSRKGHTTQKNLYKKLKQYSESIGVEKFIEELYSFSKFYNVLISTNPEKTKNWLEEEGFEKFAYSEEYYLRINNIFQSLKLFRVTQPYPLLFSLFNCYRKTDGGAYKAFMKCIESIEKYHFINNVIARRVANEIEKTYATWSKEVYESNDFISEAEKIQNTLRIKKAPFEEFKSNFIDSITYKSKPYLHFIFDKINNNPKEVKFSQRVPLYQPELNLTSRNYNIEHILPQKNKKNFYSEEELECFDKIGNLLIIPKHTNSEFGHKDPSEKWKLMNDDKKYIGGLRYLDSFVKSYEEDMKSWNFDLIKKRSNTIAREVYEIFNY